MKNKDLSLVVESLYKNSSSFQVADNLDLLKSKLANEKARQGPKSFSDDPLSLVDAMGYKDRKQSLSFDMLKRVPTQLGVIASIIQTRCNQVATFAVPYRVSKSIGFQIRHKNSKRAPTESEEEFIQSLEQFIMGCGSRDRNPYNPLPRDDFETFLKKIVRDSLTFDQTAFEIVEDRKGIPYEFMAVDASTIRIASPNTLDANNPFNRVDTSGYSGYSPFKTLRLRDTKISRDDPRFVQVLNGQISSIFYDGELAFGVRNPRTDMNIHGYGFSEVEQIVSIISAQLYAEEYNKRFFMQGCVAGDTPVHTEHGFVPIKELEGKTFRAWNGQEFVSSDAVSSGMKRAVRTHFQSGQGIITSPDHKFLTVDEDGYCVMLPIEKLKKGAFVAQSVVDGDELGSLPRSLQRILYKKMTGLPLPSQKWFSRKELKGIAVKHNFTFEALDFSWTTIERIVDMCLEIPMYDVRQMHEKHRWSTGFCILSNSAPKGIINLKSGDMAPEQLEGFRRQWQANVEGAAGYWRTPVLQSEGGLEWIELNRSNRDMEFGQWLEFLIKIICGVFLIDPAELNFDLGKGAQQQPLFESASEWKLKASRDKGLKPLLRFVAKLINDNIVAKIDDHFFFDFVGLDELTEMEKHELRKEQVGAYMTLNEVRREQDLPDIDPEADPADLPLNPAYLQALQIRSQLKVQEQEMQKNEQLSSQEVGMGGTEEQGEKEDEDETPKYSDSFSKSISDDTKILEIDLDDWKEEILN